MAGTLCRRSAPGRPCFQELSPFGIPPRSRLERYHDPCQLADGAQLLRALERNRNRPGKVSHLIFLCRWAMRARYLSMRLTVNLPDRHNYGVCREVTRVHKLIAASHALPSSSGGKAGSSGCVPWLHHILPSWRDGGGIAPPLGGFGGRYRPGRHQYLTVASRLTMTEP